MSWLQGFASLLWQKMNPPVKLGGGMLQLHSGAAFTSEKSSYHKLLLRGTAVTATSVNRALSIIPVFTITAHCSKTSSLVPISSQWFQINVGGANRAQVPFSTQGGLARRANYIGDRFMQWQPRYPRFPWSSHRHNTFYIIPKFPTNDITSQWPCILLMQPGYACWSIGGPNYLLQLRNGHSEPTT